MRKRIFVTLLALAACFASFAQQSDNKAKGEKYYYAPYNYIQLQVGGGYTVGEAPFNDLLSLPSAAISFGRQFNDFVGLRLSASGWESKGGWGNALSRAYGYTGDNLSYGYNYVAGNLDLMVNILNLFKRADRTFELFGFVGGGVNYGFNNGAVDCSATYNIPMEYLWKDSQVLPLGRAGLMANINLNDNWAINLEGNFNMLSDKYNSKNGGNPDKYFNAFAGVTYKFGKKAVPAPVVIPEPEPEPEPVVEPVKPEPKPVVVVPEDIRRDIFFAIRSHDFTAESIAKLTDVINYMNKYPESKVSVSAYADVKTGNPRINKGYAEARRAAVVDYLVNKGIAASRITSASYGDTVQPFPENDDNRAAICIATCK